MFPDGPLPDIHTRQASTFLVRSRLPRRIAPDYAAANCTPRPPRRLLLTEPAAPSPPPPRDAPRSSRELLYPPLGLAPFAYSRSQVMKEGILEQLKKVGKLCLVSEDADECSAIRNPIWDNEVFSTSYKGNKILSVHANVELNACMEVKTMTIQCDALADFVEETAKDWLGRKVTDKVVGWVDDLEKDVKDLFFRRRLAANGDGRTVIEQIAEAALKEVSGEGHRRLHEARANPDHRGSIEVQAYQRGVEMIQQRLADAFIARYQGRGRRTELLTEEQKQKYEATKKDIDFGELEIEYSLEAVATVTAHAETEVDEQRSVDLLELLLGKKAQFSQSGRFTPVPLLFAVGFSAGVEMGLPLEMKASFAGKATITGTVGYVRTWTLTMSSSGMSKRLTNIGEDDGVTIKHTGEVAASLSVSIGAYVDVNLRFDVYIATVVNLYAEASANWRATAGGDLAACAFDNTKASTKRMCESLTPQLAPSDKVEYNSASTEVPDGQREGLYAQVGVWVYVPYPKVNVNAGIAFPGSDQAEKCLGLTLGVQWHKNWTGSMVNLTASKTFNVLGRDAEPNRLPIPPPSPPPQCTSAKPYVGAFTSSSDGCDKDLPTDWYRAPSGYSMIPTSAPAKSTCGTSATGWLTYTDGSTFTYPTAFGQTFSGVRACFHWSDSGRDLPCQWHSDGLEVTNCGSYHVFYLQPATTCDLGYCWANPLASIARAMLR
ncbi:hypothetical protein EMIHUDRAFT_104777 [Emiliania huxleyi CCMP1516]|uniref:Uncharacterized protein n=2 Tax=Emiliania huxleyi TaxID=2903 RepID=A0A0D3IJB8_EMIH1|nr:hypothetical protein EMIHUDRAFT_104777 [Emiliania huxleyi CCMP1516]EOD11353.1 hypothetical protein EMIHUDRAFT_104777 [Emiliania huxleyi CCMP1516]|eukprot:XP_005763782.1 hypothetical protein EMIHUDRAFT_104777 [Emiliania huxleyi CCMP1516]